MFDTKTIKKLKAKIQYDRVEKFWSHEFEDIITERIADAIDSYYSDMEVIPPYGPKTLNLSDDQWEAIHIAEPFIGSFFTQHILKALMRISTDLYNRRDLKRRIK